MFGGERNRLQNAYYTGSSLYSNILLVCLGKCEVNWGKLYDESNNSSKCCHDSICGEFGVFSIDDRKKYGSVAYMYWPLRLEDDSLLIICLNRGGILATCFSVSS